MWILPLQGNRIAWCVGGPDPRLLQHSSSSSTISSGRFSSSSQGRTSTSSFTASTGSHGSGYSSGRQSPHDWYPETAVEVCEEVRNFKCPYGGSVMDIIEATPKGLVSKVLLEEKMYHTWYHGRIVLVGDGK
jgi:hypothetical protein